MRLHIDDQVYDLQEAVGGASLADLVTLKKQRDLSVKSITERFKKVGTGHRTALDLLDDLEYLEAVIAVVWLSRRKAGEAITIDEAGAVTFSSVSFSWSDEEEAADGDDPKDESGGAASVNGISD